MRRRLLSTSGLALLLAACADDGSHLDPEDQQRNATLLDGDCLAASCCPAGLTVVEGSAGADLLLPSSADLCVLGKEGGDLIVPQAGHGQRLVILAGPDGDQIHSPTVGAELYGGSGGDNVYGSPGDDVIDTGPGADQGFGYGGSDFLRGDDGDDVLHGGSGPDEVHGGAGNDTIYGDQDNLGNSPSDDVLDGGAGNDTVFGEGGADEINGGVGDDLIHGGDGADSLVGGLGGDEIYGGAGDDLLVVRHACELEVGEVLDGGTGTDTVRSPYTQQQLALLGIVVTDIEVFEVVAEDPGSCDETPPQAWQVEPTTGIRFRETSPFERLANGWEDGSFVIEWELETDLNGDGELAIPVGPVDAVAAPFEFGFTETDILVSEISGPTGNPSSRTPVFTYYGGTLNGLPSVSFAQEDGGEEYFGLVEAQGSAFDARRVIEDETLDPSLDTVNPTTLLEPSPNSPVVGDLVDPGNREDLGQGQVDYSVGLTADGGFTTLRGGNSTNELWMRLLAMRADMLQATIPLVTPGQPTEPNDPVPTIWLFGSYIKTYSMDPLQCSRDLRGGYMPGDPGVANDPNKLPITSGGVPLIDTEDDPLPSSCLLPSGKVYPFADCGYPGIASCMRDRGWTAFNEWRNNPTDPLPANREPDLIMVFGTGPVLTSTPTQFDQGFFNWNRSGSGNASSYQSCGLAVQVDIGNNGIDNAEWLPVFAGPDVCTRCGDMPLLLANGPDRKGLSTVGAPTVSLTSCFDIVAAHEAAHNFAATHEDNFILSPTGFPAAPECTLSGRQPLMISGPATLFPCVVPYLSQQGEGENNRQLISDCLSDPTCDPRRGAP